MHLEYKEFFEEGVRTSLATKDINFNNLSSWQETAFDALIEKAKFYIEVRGVESWEYVKKTK